MHPGLFLRGNNHILSPILIDIVAHSVRVVIKIVHSSHVFVECVLSGYSYNLPQSHTLDIDILGPNGLISDEIQDYLSELPDGHTRNIGIECSYGQISDE